MKPKIILLAVCVVICLIASKTTFAQICEQDSSALIDFFNSTNGPSWTYGNDWISNPGSFYGVKAHQWEGNCSRVTEINLPNNNITDTIPSSFGILTEMKYVALGQNRLSGRLPASMGEWTKLVRLKLHYNLYLEGEIPPGIGNNKDLTVLELQGNSFSGPIPSTFGSLDNLEILSLAGNELSGAIPPSLGNCSNLEYLDLSGNQLVNPFPTQLTGLQNLWHLSIAGNSFTGEIPSSIGYITSLTNLNISGTINGSSPQFSGTLPSSFGLLSNLQVLNAYDNELSGELPVGVLSQMTSLTTLNLSGNKFSGIIPASIDQLGGITWLDLSDNEFTRLPSSIGSLGALKNLNLSENQFENLPDEMNSLSSLEILDVSYNQLTEIPDLSGISALQTLSVGNNRLDFDDLISALDYAMYLNYYPQAELELVQSIEEGELLLTMEAGGTQTTFQWFYQNQQISGATDKTFTPDKSKDPYSYHCQAKNALFPYLTLTGRPSKGSPCIEFSVFEFCTEQEYWDKVEGKENQLTSNGKVSINDLLNFEGNITIDTVELTVKAEGEFYISDIPLPGGNVGKYTFSKGEYELKLLGEDGKITQFLNNELDSVGEICGFELKLSSLQLVGGRNASGIKMDCKISVPGVAGSCGESDETKSEIELKGLEFSTSGIALEGLKIADLGLILDGYCLKELEIGYDSEKDIFTSGAMVNLPFGDIGGGIKMQKGALDSIAWHLETTAPAFVLGTTTIGIKGFYGHISNIVNPPYEIVLGGIFTDVAIDNLYLMDVKGKTVWPTFFEVEGNGKFMKPPLSEKPYQINGGIKMSYAHPEQMFALGITGKIGTADEEKWLIDGKGDIKLYTKFNPPKLVGSMEGKMTLEKFEDKFPYNWLNSMFSFPVEASTSCKLWWAQDRGIIGDATFQTESAGPYGLHYIFDLNKSYDQEGFLYWDASIEEKSARIKSGSNVADKVENVTIPENTDFSVIGVVSNSKAPASTLKNPEGKIYSTTNQDDKVIFSISTDEKEAFWTIKNPLQGTWEITVQDPAENDSILLFIQEKRADLELSFTQNGNNVEVTWNGESFSEESEIVILLDENSTGYDGFTVAQGTADTGQSSFNINDSLSECSYNLCAMVLDGMKLVNAYAEGQVNINKAYLEAPVILVASYSSSSETIQVSYKGSTDNNTIGYIVDVTDESGNDSTYLIQMAGGTNFEIFVEDFESKTIKMTSFNYEGLKGCPSSNKAITDIWEPKLSDDIVDKFVLYPNPAKNRINIRSFEISPYQLELVNLNGQILKQKMIQKRIGVLDISQLKQGLYIIRITSGKEVYSYRFVKF